MEKEISNMRHAQILLSVSVRSTEHRNMAFGEWTQKLSNISFLLYVYKIKYDPKFCELVQKIVRKYSDFLHDIYLCFLYFQINKSVIENEFNCHLEWLLY